MIYNAVFEKPEMRRVIMAPMPGQSARSKPRKAPEGTPLALRHLWEVPLLTPAQEAHLFRKMNYLRFRASQVTGEDPAAKREREKFEAQATVIRNDIVRANLRLVVNMARQALAKVHHCARWYSHQFDENELLVLVSDGNISLMRAVDGFDYGRGNRFSTYACWALRKNYSRDITKSNRDAVRCISNQPDWFDARCGRSGSETEEATRAESQKSYVADLLRKLDAREREVIRLRVFEDWTLEEVGAHFGLTKERVRQLQVRAMKRLREVADEDRVEL